MKRRIIRGFFIALLLLFVVGWWESYTYDWGVRYKKHDELFASCNWGKIHLDWDAVEHHCFMELDAIINPGWNRWVLPASADRDSSFITPPNDDFFGGLFSKTPPPPPGHYYFGFFARISADHILIVIPFWFPTLISALMLYLAWHWTRSNAKGRGFPVDAKNPANTAITQ